MKPDFCTYFDSGYLPRALALYASLLKHSPGSRLFAVCMDANSFEVLNRLNLPDLVPIRRTDFEQDDEALVATSRTRSVVEYYFTCTPSVTLFVMRQNPDIEILFYVDSDMYFMGSVCEMLDDMGDASVYIVEHRFPPELDSQLIYGRFNVGVLGFRNNPDGIHCLSHWRQQCIEWCFDRLEGNRFGDQKYLDQWPSSMRGLRIAQHPGVNVAPWNRMTYQLSIHHESGQMRISDRSLICFHFQGLRFYSNRIVEPLAVDYGCPMDNLWFRLVYKPYINLVTACARKSGSDSTAKRIGKQPDATKLRLARNTGVYSLKLGPLLVSLTGWKMDIFLVWLRVLDYRRGLLRRLRIRPLGVSSGDQAT